MSRILERFVAGWRTSFGGFSIPGSENNDRSSITSEQVVVGGTAVVEVSMVVSLGARHTDQYSHAILHYSHKSSR
jgi:hypothetical protein